MGDVKLLKRVAKLRRPIAYECGRGCTHKDCEKTRKYNHLITDIENTIKGQKGKLDKIASLKDELRKNIQKDRGQLPICYECIEHTCKKIEEVLAHEVC